MYLPLRCGFLSILLIAQLNACSNPRPKVQADPTIQNSFTILDQQSGEASSQIGMTEQKFISIRKDALDKEFLLQGSMMRQIPMPTANGLKSRIVAFKRSANSLFMMEATQGHVITKDLPSQMILAKFPIISESDKDLVLDFGMGMAETFVAGDWYSSDEGEAYIKTFRGLDIKNSFIEAASFHGNALSIRQIAQVTGTQLDTIEVKYYLEPYLPNPNFKSTAGQPLTNFGFFEVAPQYQSDKGNGALDVYASKWDTSKPIVYAISANTPVEYVEAVREGILYWNRAFLNAPLQAVVAPQGVTAPNYDYNVVQWVPWDSAGYAYADAQMDPRTGEIRHAQVFMTSTFAVSGESRAKALLKAAGPKTKVLQEVLAMSGMIQKPLCNFELQDHFFVALEKLLASNAPDTEFLRISQDYIREVVAHEVGHTLGLRHNFAGSLASSYTLDQRAGIVQDYITQQKIPDDLQPASSVMEYQVFEEAAMTGQIISKTSRILDYDKKVIGALYSGEDLPWEDLPPFCSDSQTDHWDCQTFDLGRDPIEFISWSKQQQEQNLVQNLFNSILRAKKAGSDPALFVDTWATRLIGNRSSLYLLLSETTPLIQVRRQFSVFDDNSSAKMLDAEQSYLQNALDQNGGWEQLLAVPSEKELQTIPFTLRKMMRDYQVTEGDKVTSFSLEEQQRYEASMQDFTHRLQGALQKAQWATVASKTIMTDSYFTEKFLSWIDKEARTILLSSKGSIKAKKFLKEGGFIELSLPDFAADAQLRSLVVQTLAAMPTESSWQVKAIKESLGDDLNEILNTYLPDSATIKFKELDSAAQAWRAQEQALITTLAY